MPKAVNKKISNGIKRNKLSSEKFLEKQAAWVKGKTSYITIENPNKTETNKPFIRVKYSDTREGMTYKEWVKVKGGR